MAVGDDEIGQEGGHGLGRVCIRIGIVWVVAVAAAQAEGQDVLQVAQVFLDGVVAAGFFLQVDKMLDVHCAGRAHKGVVQVLVDELVVEIQGDGQVRGLSVVDLVVDYIDDHAVDVVFALDDLCPAV